MCELTEAELNKRKEQRANLFSTLKSVSATMEVDSNSIRKQAEVVKSLFVPQEMDESSKDIALDLALTLATQSSSSDQGDQISAGIQVETREALGSICSDILDAGKIASSSAVEYSDSTTGNSNNSSDTKMVEQAVKVTAIIDNVLGATASQMIEGQEPEEIKTASFVASVALENSAAMSQPGAMVVASSGSKFEGFGEALENVTGSVVSKAAKYNKNIWTAELLDSPIISLSLSSGKKAIIVHNLTQPIQIFMPISTFAARSVFESLSTIPEVVEANCVGTGGSPYNISVNCSDGNQYLFECPGEKDAILQYTCPSPIFEPLCQFWNETLGKYSSNGCVLHNVTADGTVVCNCTHLTDFASKLGTVFSDAGTILANPKFQRSYSAEELADLLDENAVVITTVGAMFALAVASCISGRQQDELDKFFESKSPQQLEAHLWASGRGIISPAALELDAVDNSLCSLWINAVSVYHPLFSVYFTHSLALTRPHRIMVLLCVVFANMTVDAMFYQVRHGDPNDKPNFIETLGFSVVSSLLNVPVVSLFQALYQMVGASAVTRMQYDIAAKKTMIDVKSIHQHRND